MECFLDVLVVLDRFAILDYDFFVKKIIFVKSCQNEVITFQCQIGLRFGIIENKFSLTLLKLLLLNN